MVKIILRHRLLAAASLLAAATISLVIGVQFYAGQTADTAARIREETVVRNGLTNRLEEISRLPIPQTVWDESVRNLDVRFDRNWAHENIGTFLHQTSGFDASLVIAADGGIAYVMRDGADVAAARGAHFHAAAKGLIDAVRVAERKRGDLGVAVQKERTLSDPILESAVNAVDGELYLLTAVLVQPDFGKTMPRSAHSPIVIAAKAIDAGFIKSLSDRFLLDGVEFVPPDGALRADRGHAPLNGVGGELKGTFEWAPPKPGVALLSHSLPPTAALILALCVVALVLQRHSARSRESLVASEARASHLAYHDALTGLPNRVMLDDRLGRALDVYRRTQQGFAVLCIDLDRFKEVNDTFGHHVGDELIRAVAHILTKACRPSDTLARLGGDEFAIILADVTPAAASAFASRLCKLMKEPIQLDVGRIFIGCSVGISMTQNETGDRQELLRQADLALYRAKDGGRGQFSFFEPEMDASMRTQRALQEDLRHALDTHQLELHYQPQVNARGEVFGVEALMRWSHPTRGPISPAVFVPLAEQCGLIDQLGMFALRRAFEDSRQWPGIRIAVNVSASQLRLKDFPFRVEALVQELGISPARFELEITEGLLLGDDPQTHEALRRLRAVGFHIALDDFGTGYSSLSYLRRYPIDKIKIDRSFITNLGTDAESEAVVSAMVRLARALRLDVIAEGVETADQRQSLAAAGCQDIQGYLVGKPAPAATITAALNRVHAA